MNAFQQDLLYLLRDPEARYNVQRLDRTLVQRWDPAMVVTGLMPALRELEQAGLIRSEEVHTDRTRYTLYASTAAGRSRLDAGTTSPSL